MFTTSQFRVFATEPGERALASARTLLQAGDHEAAEEAYLDIIDEQPELKLAWGEYFQMLRNQGRFEEALALSAQAADQFGDSAFPLALKGAALVEQGRFREALVALEQAADRDPDFALVWHEAGYAAYRLGEYARALLALDRAFALDPHSGTLHLRGKILRSAGRYLAAEVAFEGAAQAAEFEEQRVEALRQVQVTRRYASFSAGKPGDLHPSRRWFAETGTIPLTYHADLTPPTDETLVKAFGDFVAEQRWAFTAIHPVDDWSGWQDLAQRFGLTSQTPDRWTDDSVPLLVSRQTVSGDDEWDLAREWIRSHRSGLVFVLRQSPDAPAADVIGLLSNEPGAMLDLTTATELVQHPECVLQGRRLGRSN